MGIVPSNTSRITPRAEGDASVMSASDAPTTAGVRLRTRVVREPRRETWFVVNESDDDIATIPVELAAVRSIRNVQVNGEVAEFTAGPELVLVRPQRPLRAGAGTIVVLHFR